MTTKRNENSSSEVRGNVIGDRRIKLYFHFILFVVCCLLKNVHVLNLLKCLKILTYY